MYSEMQKCKDVLYKPSLNIGSPNLSILFSNKSKFCLRY